MNQTTFQHLTGGTGALYRPFAGTAPHYELISISVLTGNVNNRIRVIVVDEFGVEVYHRFGNDFEVFPYAGDPVQFNLGGGSHYSPPDEPPDRISVDGSSDEVLVGNSSQIGFGHTDWLMTFRMTGGAPPIDPPIEGNYVTRAEFDAFKARLVAACA